MSNGWNKVKRLFWLPPEQRRDDPDTTTRAPASEVTNALSVLKDVEGVLGSVVVDTQGLVVGSDLPRVFDGDAVQQVGQHLAALRTTIEQDPRAPLVGDLEYEDFVFHIKAFSNGTIGVLLEQSVQRPALSMALNLVCRRVTSTLSQTV